MLEVTINGQKTFVPPCTCGKCIVRRLRKDFFNGFPYSKDMASTYKDDYPWKTNDPENPDDVYNRAKHSNFDGQYKENIPTSLMSTMKMDYRPFKVKSTEPKKKEVDDFKIPFMGKSVYKKEYPNWGAMTPVPDSPEDAIPDIQVPLRGISNYNENYVKHPDEYYKKGDPLNFSKPTLKFDGDLDPRTTYNEAYKPVDNTFRDDNPFNAAKGENTALMSADNAPGAFDTTYKRDYKKYGSGMCELRKYLNARNMRYLVI
jgi:hypothetical protein